LTADGEIRGTYYYDAFGNILEVSGNADNPIRYAGYMYDEETGLYYLNARYYDPKIARFLSEDTYRGTPDDPLSLNLYTYCNNNPIKYYDPTGHILSEWDKENLSAEDQEKIEKYTMMWNYYDSMIKTLEEYMKTASTIERIYAAKEIAKLKNYREEQHKKAEDIRDKYRGPNEIPTGDGNTIVLPVSAVIKKDTNNVSGKGSSLGTQIGYGGYIVNTGISNSKAINDAIKGVSGDYATIQVQAYLSVMGFPIGTAGPNKNGVDGKLSEKDRASIKLFQLIIGLPQTGNIDDETLKKLEEYAYSGITLKQLAKEAYNNGIKPEIIKGSTQAERVNIIYFYALIDEDITGVPAAITVAQSLQESSAGRYIPIDKYKGTYSYNLFGIKSDKRWLNKGGGYVISDTWEHINGKDIIIEAKFRSYNSYLESIFDHSQFLKDNSRYSSLFDIKKDEFYLINWAKGLQNAGYATDPNYATKLINHINEYGLK